MKDTKKQFLLDQALAKVDFKRLLRKDFNDVCPYTSKQLMSKNREQKLCAWRHMSMLYDAALTGTLEEAGKMNNRNHSTVVHALKRIIDYNKGDLIMCDIVASIKSTIFRNENFMSEVNITNVGIDGFELIGLIRLDNMIHSKK